MVQINLTPQEAFDTVARHLFAQGRLALRDFGGEEGCVYRGDDGCKCAVGILIPDELYDPKMEGHSAASDSVGPLFPPSINNLLCDLQKAHDDCSRNDDGTFNVAALRDRLSDIAAEHSLSSAILETL